MLRPITPQKVLIELFLENLRESTFDVLKWKHTFEGLHLRPARESLEQILNAVQEVLDLHQRK